MIDTTTIALIDDDDAILDSVQIYLERKGIVVRCYRAADAFMAELDDGTAFDCVITDVKMPRMTGLDLQRALSERKVVIPLILITGHGDIDMAVMAIKAGASDFIEKPIDGTRLIASVSEAVKRDRDQAAADRATAVLAQRYAELSRRQQDVLGLAVQGLSNKEIAVRLSISPRTVEHYRESAMERMHARSLAEMVHMAVRLNILSTPLMR